MSIQVTEDEVDKKHRRIQEILQKNPEYREVLARRQEADRTALVGKKDDKHYRWVAKRRVEERKTQGYSIVECKDGTAGVASQMNVDNTVGIKDELVLMAEPRDLHELKQAQNEERAKRHFQRKMDDQREGLEKMARDEGLSKPHQSVVVDTSREGHPSEALVVAKRKLPG